MGAGSGTVSKATRIGVVTLFASDDAYERGVIAGVIDVVRERRISMVCFAIQGVRDEFDRFVHHESVDGLIVLAGSIAQRVGHQTVEAFFEKLRPFPMVSMAMGGVPAVPTIRVDNKKGVIDSIAHLVKVHGRRKIGFIQGPADSADGAERLLGYKAALAEHGIPLEPAWITPHLPVVGGAEAVRILFDERKQPIDALVAFNDSLALGALSALLERGLGVPQNVAVIGFDDISEASHVIPPLTTVTQKLANHGRRAAELLLDVISGNPAPEQVLLETELVVRGSCGCLPRHVLEARAGHPQPAAQRAAWPGVRSEVARELDRLLGDDITGATDKVLDAFAADLADGSSRSFLAALDLCLSRAARAGADISRWGNALSAMRRISLPYVIGDEQKWSIAEDLWQEGMVLVGETGERSQAYQRFLALGRAHTLGAISQSLITVRDIEELADVLAHELPRLGVKSCYVSLYDDRESWQTSTLVLGVEEGGVATAHVGARFSTEKLVPDGVLVWSRILLAMPLSFQNQQLGLIVLEVPPAWHGAYDELRKQFGAAVKRLEGERELERLHALQRERTEELERAYQALRENQEKLLISEKMASLGRLTAGMAHEMNTPLAAVRAALDELSELTEEYEKSIGDQEVTLDDHREIVREMEASIKLADSAAESVAGFVSGIKAKTRDMSSTEFRDFDAVPVIQESLLLLQHMARKAHCDVSFEHDSDKMQLFGAPGRLSQVITNLVTNAIDATADKGSGPIVVRLGRWEQGLELSVIDKGTGILPENLKRIFDPMFTTKPFGMGTGLGLTIVHDIVTGDFNGTIEVDTEPGEGTTFRVRLGKRAT